MRDGSRIGGGFSDSAPSIAQTKETVLMTKEEKMEEALRILQLYNPIRNDRDAYLFYVTEWALEERKDKPNPKHFGLE